MEGVCVLMLRKHAFQLHAFEFRYICWQVNVGAEGGTDVAQSAGAGPNLDAHCQRDARCSNLFSLVFICPHQGAPI